MAASNALPDTRRQLEVGDRSYEIFSLEALRESGFGDPSRLPCSLKILLENLLRHVEQLSLIHI